MDSFSDHFDPPPWAAFLLRWLRRIALVALLVPLLFLLAEGAVRLFRPGHPTRFLQAGEVQGRPVWLDNPFFTYRFHSARTARPPLPLAAPRTPATNAIRVCLLGGGELQGEPAPAFGVGRQLEVMLRSRYPDRPVEVLNLSLEVGNSHVLREVARDLKRLAPTAVVVLTGNDEVAGPYGPATGFGRLHRSSRLARAMVLFSRTRLSQACIAAINRLSPARTDLDAWRSHEPATLRGRLSPRDPRLKTVLRSYRKNLRAILRQAAAASPAVVACTVPVNLRDCAPFATSHPEDETVAQEVRESLRAAAAAEVATNRTQALRLYAGAIRRAPDHADALYRAGQIYLELRRPTEAASLFARARDADALRLRADSRLNALVRECAAAEGVSLLDAEELFANHAAPGGPGGDLFLDHVHFTFSGHYLLATALLDRLEFLNAFATEPAGPVPAEPDVDRALLFRPWGRSAQLGATIARMTHAPFRRQSGSAGIRARLVADKHDEDKHAESYSPANIRAIFARTQAHRPDDAWLATRATEYLLRTDAPELAEAAARTAYEHWPHRYEIRGLLALVQTVRGQAIDAGIAFLRGPDGRNGYYDIQQAIAIGRELFALKRYAPARAWFEYAAGRDPWNSEAAIALAETLFKLKQSDDAARVLAEATERNPDNPVLWEARGLLHCWLRQLKRADEYYQKSAELAPFRYEHLLPWAQALARRGLYAKAQPPLERYLALVPEDPEALALRARILQRLPAAPEEPAEEDEPRRFPWE